MFLVVRTPCKTVGPVSDKIGGHKRTTGEAGIATTGESPLPVLAWGVSAISRIRLGLHWKLISHLASLSSSRQGCDSRRFRSETTLVNCVVYG